MQIKIVMQHPKQSEKLFPASRGSFPAVCWWEKRDLCHGSKMAVLSMLCGLATEPLRNAHSAWRKQTSSSFSLSSWSNSFSFILTALNLSVWQDSSWSDMSTLSGETTTTNGFDGRLSAFSFVQQQYWAIWSDNRDKRFPMPVQKARKRVSPI